ncbi:MAG: O-antigen ligase family protein [Bacillota bacterium]
MNTLLLIAPVMLIRRPKNLERTAAQALAVVTAIYFKIGFFPVYQTISAGTKYMRGGFAFGAEGAAAGVALSASYAMYLFIVNRNLWVRLACTGSLGILMYGLIMSGTRATAFCIALIAPAYVAFLRKPNYRRSAWALLIIGLVGSLALSYISPPQQIARLLGVFSGDASVEARSEHWATALQAFADHPMVGLGVGGYSTYSTGLDMRWFPHNIILEALAELGIVGTLLLLLLLATFSAYVRDLLHYYRSKDRLDQHVMIEVFVVASILAFLQAMVTDDLADNRWLWLMMGLTYAASGKPLAQKRSVNLDSCLKSGQPVASRVTQT